MLKRLVILMTIFTITFSFAACKNSKDKRASLDPLSGTGTHFYLRFTGNPSTGYSWNYTQREDDAAGKLLLIDVKEEEGNSAPGLVGAGGKTTYTFTAEKPGENVLVFTYRRPWTGGEEAYSVEYDLVIDEEKNIKCVDRRIINKDSEADIAEIPYPFFYVENN